LGGGFDQAYRIQVLWDEAMADSVAGHLASEGAETKHLLVLAGGNHFRYGIGIPRRVFRRVPVAYTIVETYPLETPPEKQMEVEIPELPMRPADVYWAIGYQDLEDQRVMLGVQIQETEGGGARVLGVVPGSPAEKAGVLKGDVIVAVDGAPVEELFDLTYRVGLHKPGDTGPLEVVRADQRLTLEVSYDVLRHGRE
jgi:membrane-associated protease RseP (regulator of RpoE activity)